MTPDASSLVSAARLGDRVASSPPSLRGALASNRAGASFPTDDELGEEGRELKAVSCTLGGCGVLLLLGCLGLLALAVRSRAG